MRYELTKDLETGNAIIDREHQELFQAVNQLLDSCGKGQGRAASLIPEESAPDSGSVFQFNWTFLLVPLGVTALAGGGMGTALFLKRRDESEEGTE